MLLDRGAGIDARNGWGWTPLFFAVTQHHPEVAELLLSRGADPNATARSGGRRGPSELLIAVADSGPAPG